jgi:hypothetical protein
MNEDFKNNLIALSKQNILEDCKPCIKKIQNLLITLSSKFQQDSSLLSDIAFIKKPSMQEDKKKIAQEKMEKLKGEFAKKQALFAEKQKELSPTKDIEFEEPELAPEEDEAKFTCQYCLEKIDKVKDEYGVPIYVAFTNNFYEVDEENIKFEQINYAKLADEFWWPVVSSCNHHYHKNCFEILYSIEDAGKSFIHNRFETYCSLCKTLCNNFLCLNKGEAIEKKEPSQQEKELFPELHLEFSQKVHEVQYQQVVYLQSLSGMNPTQILNQPYIPRSIMLVKAYNYFIDSFYLTKDFEAKRSLFEMYAHFFRNFASELKEQEIGKISQYLEFDSISLQLPCRDAFNFLNSYPLEIYMCLLFTEEIGDYSLQKSIGSVSKVDLMKRHTAILRKYLDLIILQTLSYDKVAQAYSLSFEEQINLLFEDSNLYKDRLSDFIFPLQKIILAMAINQQFLLEKPPVLKNEFFKLIFSPNSKIETIQELLSLIEIPFTIKDIVKSIFEEIKTNMYSRPLLCKTILPVLSDTQNINIHELTKTKFTKKAPRIISLPPTYAEYNNTFLRKKCKLCNKFCNHMYTFMCFICGDVFCQGYCPSVHEPPEKLKEPCTKCNGKCPPRHEIVGNLNRHAAKHHMGMGIFLDIFQPFTNVINPPLNAISPSKNIYIDSLGQPVQVYLTDMIDLKSIDFKKFTLNPEFVAEVEDVVKNHGVAKECFKVLLDYPPEDQIPPPAEL